MLHFLMLDLHKDGEKTLRLYCRKSNGVVALKTRDFIFGSFFFFRKLQLMYLNVL